MYTELDHNLRAPVQYNETSTQEGKQRSGQRWISNSVCTERENREALIFRGGRYNEHTEIKEIGQRTRT